MDFFEQQERSRSTSRWLVLWYLVAVTLTVASYAAVGALLSWRLAAAIAALVAVCVLWVSAYRMWQFRDGGYVVADLLGAEYVSAEHCSPAERKLLNVVEEMSIASGVSVPPVYVIRREDAVNALVAGYSPNEAVIVVTAGAVEKLSRDELQGVMGHEFSHILNGDMALNLRLAALLAGLTWIGERAEALFFGSARAQRAAGEEGSTAAFAAVFAAAVAFIGFPGTLAASAIRASVSRQRELLADAGSVQFTRNADAIAGALDSIVALGAGTVVLAAHAPGLAHMFFAPATGNWFGFATHPSIDERVRRVHPRFLREDYRARRHGRRAEVAVLDDAGNVVKSVRTAPAEVVASVGRPTPEHVDFSRRLLESLPPRLRQALRSAPEAERVLFALGGFSEPAGELSALVESVAPQQVLTLAELALPAVKAQPQPQRDRFLAEYAARVERDGRVTLHEFVLLTLLRQRLREGAGAAIPTRYQKVEEIADDARALLTLVARVSGDTSGNAFAAGARVLGLGGDALAAGEKLTSASVSASLERLRLLAPFAKPALLRACVEIVMADGRLRLAEAEILRAIAATLDCPVPPVLAAQDPLLLAA
ncbi:MAG TPA: M48 family metalloprotease [Burkholderiales bacterium]|nr:M48 family metalloprotease [Burkholderiales bacterium]